MSKEVKTVNLNLQYQVSLAQMKKNKIRYWITTGLLSATMLYTAFSYFSNEEMKNSFVRLGFPDYFRIELAIAKALGAIVLILPHINGRLKEVAYVGFAITFISAFIAHVSNGDPVFVSLQALILLAVLTGSYFYFHRIEKALLCGQE
jgi:hypothetical protein